MGCSSWWVSDSSLRVRVGRANRTKDVQERVLQTEELVAVGRHDGVMCWVVVRGLWYVQLG